MGTGSTAIRRCAEDIIGSGCLTDSQWAQACLPLRMGGLGFKDPCLLQDCARVAGTLSALNRCPEIGFPSLPSPSDFDTTLNHLRTSISPFFGPLPSWENTSTPSKLPIENEHRNQRWWSTALYSKLKERLSTTGTLRDQCRFTLQKSPHSTAWMLAIPGDHSRFTGPEYRTLLKWWLGLPLFRGNSAKPCPLCNEPMDPFGDHLASCTRNHLTNRHHEIRNAIAHTLKSHGVSCLTEVQLPGRLDRPGDIALPTFDSRGPLMVDLCAIHPLAPHHPRNVATVTETLQNKEEAKENKYMLLCRNAGYLFCPLGFHL